MVNYTSIIPPNNNMPEPDCPQWISRLFALVLSVIFGGFVLFVCIEFLMDMLGSPFSFAPKAPPKQPADASKEIMMPFDDSVKNFKLITPKDKTRTASPETVILVHWKPENPAVPNPLYRFDLWVDECFIPWDMQYGQDTWFAKVPFTAGKHHIRTPAFESEFFVETPDAPGKQQGPPDWTFFRLHPCTDEADQCGKCHLIEAKQQDVQTKHRSLTVGRWKGTDSCFDCHKRNAVEQTHKIHLPSTNAPPAQRCTECHTVH
ncbi:MAG: hypothetical protein LBT46_08165 [Planctomycetaceae bacterium]|jgi:hypothetical protein|nr:hypothetical protein [Planctomycetaceae bacterium]